MYIDVNIVFDCWLLRLLFSHLFYIFAFLFGFWWHLQVKQKTEMLLRENRSKNGTYILSFWFFPIKNQSLSIFICRLKKKNKNLFGFRLNYHFWEIFLIKWPASHTHTYVYWHRIVKWIGRRSLETKSAPRKLINECCFSQTTTTHTNQQQKQEKISEKIWILCLCVSFFIKFTAFSDFSLYFCVCARFNLIKIFVRKISILNKNKYQK